MKPEESYLIQESEEISVGESPHWTDPFFRAFPALRYRNYRLYFFGQLVSLVGTWLQTVAQGYLVYLITKSALWVGLIAALQTLPVLLFALIGGVIVDRFNKRRVLFVTQSGQMILAFILGILALTGTVNQYHIAVLSFLLGIFTSIDMPARQTYMNKMVARKHLSSAISLSAGIFNAARVIGPASAGILISIVAVGGAFMLNGVSFIAVIVALYFMNVREVIADNHLHPLRAIQQGLRFAFSDDIIRPVLLLATVNSIFGWSYITIMPVIAGDVFHEGARGCSSQHSHGALLLGTLY
ncbi:MFS transporter [Candidatus Microgenomates bacterium]|nr:MFS transporter [Candidatus Microgenomates bacterium]